MSLPKKGSRKIQVDGLDYRWLIRKKPSYIQGIGAVSFTIAIERFEEEHKGLLLVHTGLTRLDNWIDPHQTSVTPKVVREMIQTALNGGWNPANTEPFLLDFQLIKNRI